MTRRGDTIILNASIATVEELKALVAEKFQLKGDFKLEYHDADFNRDILLLEVDVLKDKMQLNVKQDRHSNVQIIEKIGRGFFGKLS